MRNTSEAELLPMLVRQTIRGWQDLLALLSLAAALGLSIALALAGITLLLAAS
jgi:hypothetical protein